MEVHWLKRNGALRLAVFVLGWAADHRVVEHIALPATDVVCLYDWRDVDALRGEPFEAKESRGEPEMVCDTDTQHALHALNALRESIAAYEERYLFAWSFGVWAAEQLFAGVVFTRAVAFNGTPHPVDERFGIEPRRMDVTIRGIEKGGMEPFNRRAYGAEYERLAGVLSPRPLADNVAELRMLRDLSVQPYAPVIQWDRAVVGAQDEIFPPHNMQNYWGSRAESLPLPHYPFADGQIILGEL